MTIERWNDDRLDRLTTETATNTANIADLITATEALLRTAEAQQKEMRELQLEVRRLVEELRQRREGEN